MRKRNAYVWRGEFFFRGTSEHFKLIQGTFLDLFYIPKYTSYPVPDVYIGFNKTLFVNHIVYLLTKVILIQGGEQ